MAVFPGVYGRIVEILNGRIWPDWGLKGATLPASTPFHLLSSVPMVGFANYVHRTITLEGLIITAL